MVRLHALTKLAGPVFRDLLFRKRQCVFIAFDLLYLNGKDLRLCSNQLDLRLAATLGWMHL